MRKETYVVQVKIGNDYLHHTWNDEYPARNQFTRLKAALDGEVTLWHNREDGMNCRLEIRPAKGSGF